MSEPSIRTAKVDGADELAGAGGRLNGKVGNKSALLRISQTGGLPRPLATAPGPAALIRPGTHPPRPQSRLRRGGAVPAPAPPLHLPRIAGLADAGRIEQRHREAVEIEV